MKSLSLLGLFLILCMTFENARPQSAEAYEYDRIDEVKRECSSILPPDFDHKSYGNQLYRLPDKLSFVNGDWWQDLDKAPLLPYDDKLPDKFVGKSSPLNLTSFWITDVDDAHRSKNSVSVNGVLELGVTIDGLFNSKPFELYPIFNIYPGISKLRMSFQGIVTYSEEKNGEIVMCLLGNAVLPSRSPDSNSPWDWVKEPNYINQPRPIYDEQILLVVRYPDNFTVKKRGIHGSLKSLNPKSNIKYFDEIHISASLSSSATYEFSSQKVVSPYLYRANKDLGVIKSADFCGILNRFLGEDSLTVVPNWRCKGSDEFCRKLGPFESDASIKATNGSFNGVKLHFQDVRCEKPSSNQGKDGGFAKVAMVIRVASPSDYFYAVAHSSVLNNMTLSAEGVWDPSTGQLCMVGCRGETCHSRIYLYFPFSFSIKRRSVILGSIESVEESNHMSYFPLTFTKRVYYSTLLRDQYYEYSEIDLARAVLEKHERFSLETMIKKSFFTFPTVKDADKESLRDSLSFLAEGLTFRQQVVPESSTDCSSSKTFAQIDILSLGSLFGNRWPLQKDLVVEEDSSYADIDSQLVLNVSAQFSLCRAQYGDIFDLSVEGLYHPLVGKMYLIGCRDIRANSNLLFKSSDLEDGFDCMIEVVMSYPPTTNWLVNPISRVSITSQRNELDPLFFKPIKLQSAISSSRGVEGMLQILTPLIAIGCTLSQLIYIKENLNSVHCISLVMLVIQALGYGFPLVTGVESVVESNDNSSAYTKNQMIQVIDYRVKILVLISFLLTLRLYQKVWRSRIRLLSRPPVRPHHVPSDHPVLLVTFFIHVFGFGCFLIVHKLQSKLVKIEEYLGLVQDFFLLPQVIGNLIWQIDCKPLRKSYFVGLTVIRLLPHVYSYRSSGIPYPSSEDLPIYPAEDIVAPNFNIYSEHGSNIGISAIAIFLVITVYVQQNWSYEDLGRRLTFGKFRLLPRWSRADERLLPVEADGQLNFGFNGLLKTLQRRRGWK